MSGMGTSSSQQQQQTQQNQNFTGQKDPWAAALPGLTQLLGGVNSQFANYQPNAYETNALDAMRANAGSLPSYYPQAKSAADYALSGGGGILDQAFNTASSTLNPYLTASYTDPTKTPGLQSALDVVRNDVSNSVNSQFAGAGRDLSGANLTALGRGISQGEAPILLGQYNTNVAQQMAALDAMRTAASGTVGQKAGLQQQGLGIAGTLGDFQNTGNAAMLQAEGMRRALPLSGLGSLASLLLPIAGLGGTTAGNAFTQGTTVGSGTQTASPLQQMLMMSQMFGNIFGGGGGNAAGNAAKLVG